MGISVRDHALLCEAIVALLKRSRKIHPAWEIEELLAGEFQVTSDERSLMHPAGCPVFGKDVAFGLSRAVRRKLIENVGNSMAPNGGTRCLYRSAASL
jgi:hypothetical protein